VAVSASKFIVGTGIPLVLVGLLLAAGGLAATLLIGAF